MRRAIQVFRDVQKQVDLQHPFLYMHAPMKLTKSPPSTETVLLERVFDLEEEVKAYLLSRISFEELTRTYQPYGLPPDWSMPRHLPCRVAYGTGPFERGENIFVPLAEVLGVRLTGVSQTIGVELIDVWDADFRRIFDCTDLVFTRETRRGIDGLLKSNLPRAAYLASIPHELGHQVGLYKVNPRRDPSLQVKEFHFDVLGELWTDALASVALAEFPEVGAFSLNYRIFKYGRRGFLGDSRRTRLNVDNDALTGALLWSRLTRAGVLVRRGRDYDLDLDGVAESWAALRDDLVALSEELRRAREGQDKLVAEFLARDVPVDTDGRYELPADLRAAYCRCAAVPESADYRTLLGRRPAA